MKTIRSFIRSEPVLVISVLAALVSCFFVPPDRAYLGYIDLRTLALLYCLMTVIAGLRGAGVFEYLAHALCSKAGNVRAMGSLLVLLSFISSMLITNDVALLTFVPFAIVVLGGSKHRRELITIVVLQTVAANLGSMLTPVGNPQNLYLYSYYGLGFGEFLGVTFPIWALSLVLILLTCLALPKDRLESSSGEEPDLQKRSLWLYLMLLSVCLLTVLRVCDWPVMLAVVILTLLIFDRGILLRADFMLLLTFVAFFIFAGNLARVDAVNALLRRLISGHEFLAGLLSSQVISNVPAALLLSGFTENARALILGVNVGGLGTPIASLASLISMKIYSRAECAQTGRYLLVFTVVNIVLLILLSLACILI